MNKIIYLKLRDLQIPIQVIEEFRQNARVAFGKDAILLRIPKQVKEHRKSDHIDWAVSWLKKTFVNKPKVFERYRPIRYFDGKMVITVHDTYEVKLHTSQRNTLRGRLSKNNILIELPSFYNGEEKQIGKIVSKCLAKAHLDWFKEEVYNLNKSHFGESISHIALRYAETRWGSCNSKGKISISTRALLAPKNILDHVIIHELAHLKELNHSPSFWKWVSKADPNYKSHDKWLREHGYKLKF